MLAAKAALTIEAAKAIAAVSDEIIGAIGVSGASDETMAISAAPARPCSANRTACRRKPFAPAAYG
jgi:hypothetical protein